MRSTHIYMATSGVPGRTSNRHIDPRRRPSPVSIPEGPARLGRHRPAPSGVTSMRNILFAAVAVLGLATAIPAFADSGDGPASEASANSLPPGFYNNTPFGIQAQIVEQHFANKGEASWQAQ